MGQDPNTVTMRERVRLVKIDKDNPDAPPEVIEQETITHITMDEASLLGFKPGQGFGSEEDRPAPVVEGVRVGD
jgi:hypothetical protein